MTFKQPIRDDEEMIRSMLKHSKEKAPENLKYRIMHQIEAEKAVTPVVKEKRKLWGKLLRETGGIFGTMYAVLAVMIGAAYFLFGKDFLTSAEFLGAAAFVGFVFTMLWLISRLDQHLQSKRFKKESNQ